MTSFNNSKRNDLIFPELSFTIVGLAFEVFNELGSGHREKVYQSAMAKQFQLKNITFQKEISYSLIFKNEIIGKNYFDFLIEDKIIIELKRSDYFSKNHFEQVNHYLRISHLRLGLLISFTTNGVRFKRVVNTIEVSQQTS
jgi:GxxExxY protein